ncbi:MAG: DUF547 domain-containing protein [Betaproteobacteria bacterium]|nr:DUF547 domain-containing protein [Betaproteobacteria bacterium]
MFKKLAFAILLAIVSTAASAFDHSHAAWTALLKKHVVLLDGGNASRVDYYGFATDMPALQRYLDSLTAVSRSEYDGWTKPQRLAFLINAYNAFTIDKVLMRYPDLESIRDFGRFFGNPWKDRFFTLFGESENLDGIEQGLIRAPGVFDEPRIHFAVNCASIGCPMLREEAYVAARLDAQLEEQTRRFLSDRSRNRYRDGRLEVSKIFDWYAKDFEAGHHGITSVRQFLARYADLLADSDAGRAAVRAQKAEIDYLDYDWSLNDVKH